MKVRIVMLVCAGLFATAYPIVSSTAAVMPIQQAAALFGARPSGFAPDLSPDGDKLVYLAAGPGASTIVHIEDLVTNEDRQLVRSSGQPEHLEWCAFASEQWVICRIGGWVKMLGQTARMTRTVAVDIASGKMRPLGTPDRPDDGRFAQFDGQILDWLPDDQGALLMQRRYAGRQGYPDSIGVDRIQMNPFKVASVVPTIARDLSYMTDGHGTVRLKIEASSDADGLFTGDSTYEYRLAGSEKWLPLPQGGKDFTPLVVERESNSLYFLKPLNGRDALYRLKLDGSGSASLIASNPNVDIDSVIQLGPGQPVVGYRYTDDRTRSVYTDPAIQSFADALARGLPQMPLMNFISSSKSGKKLLIHGGSDVDPGVFYVLDRTTRRMDPVLNASDSIDGSGLAPVKAVSVATADGKSIPAYVTMRSDLGPGPHPAIIMPHGGPADRDIWAFDWLGQFLAARGYVVVQPNFRGSSGYGKDFLGDNAFHEWRKVMSDIKDSADWLVKQGVADPGRMAIVGWSYGGYAALQSAAMDSRYKAVVAIAPVTDLKQLRRDAEGFREQTIAEAEIGKGDQLGQGSPINHARDIHAPVLMVHGTLDGNVDYDHSKRMLSALRHGGAKADLLTFDGLDHQLDDSGARVTMLTRIGEFLEEQIGH
jgi:dienelactone hydrolase